MGSVKDLTILKPAAEHVLGEGIFTFSDRYSVFDWGEMPDHINDKGKALCLISAFFLEKLEEQGIKTHYAGIIDQDGQIKYIKDLTSPTNQLKVKLVNVVKPELKNKIYNYTVFRSLKNNFLIPFEIIYRNSLPEGSSVFKRLAQGETTPEKLGLKKYPAPGEVLESPIYDVSTKLEVNDRYLSWDDAKEMACLTEQELKKIKEITNEVNRIISRECSRIGLTNEDGKIELAFDPQKEVILVDTLGTLDECRFKYKNYPISKEIARMYYRNTEWYKKAEEAKKKDRFTWKTIVGLDPEPLPSEFARLFADMYRSAANQMIGKELFRDVMPLEKIIENMQKYIH